MAIALDGHTTGSWSTGASFTVTGLTTVNTNDVIVAVVGVRGSSLVTVTSLSTTGISWNASARKQLTFNTTEDVEIWYGTASATLSSVTTTINLSGIPGGASASAGASVFGVSGANTSTISDSNVSLPATATGSASVPTVTGVSTSNANDFIVAGVAQSGTTAQTAGAGMTLIDSVSATHMVVSSEDEIVSATQSSVSIAFGTSTGTGNNWGMIVDAIQQAAAAGSTPTYGTSRLLMGVGT